MTAPHFQDELGTVYHGDCVEVMAALPEASVDAIVTDPPYGLEFMGKAWDAPWQVSSSSALFGKRKREMPGWSVTRNPTCRTCGGRLRGAKKCVCAAPAWDEAVAATGLRQMRAFQEWSEAWAVEALRVLKPGGHLLAFGGTRTAHRLVCAIEDAGFEVRDTLCWLYGSGFPKSLDVSKALDKAAGAVREVVAEGAPLKRMIPGADQNRTGSWIKDNGRVFVPQETAPATDAARQWDGWGTALKPAYEPIVLARKPLAAGNVAANVLAHGTGAINVDGCRIEADGGRPLIVSTPKNGAFAGVFREGSRQAGPTTEGRWPANVVLDEAAAAVLNEQTRHLHSAGFPTEDAPTGKSGIFGNARRGGGTRIGDAGGAARFFYTAKASTAERQGVTHPTVKPVALMRWLVRLVTPPGGVVLDCFAGSGTTRLAALAEGFRYVLIERDAQYLDQLCGRAAQQGLPL